MGASNGSCPGTAEIERLACGEEGAEGSARHVEGCAACRARVAAAKEDADFLGRMRSLVQPDMGPEGAPRIPGYRATGVVSAGSQGVVFRAVQESTSRTVAIKTLMAGEGGSSRRRARAEREAEIAARLRHSNIVTVFESRKMTDGRIAVVMEYVDGVPLDKWAPPGATPAERQRALLRVFQAVCNGIHHAHLNGVIHRDLKPDNILVTSDGRPVVLDFGIAKAGGIGTTMTGEFAGTPAYASPEQASGRVEEVDALTDVYSLGVILYKLLCGAMPYDVEGSIFEIARTIGEQEPYPPRKREPTLSPDLEAIVLRALRKEKSRRYQSAAGLARDVERYLSGLPVEARSGSGWYLLRKAVVVNRRRLAALSIGVALLAVAGLAVGLSLASAAAADRRARMEREQAHADNVRARAVAELLREALPNSDPTRPEMANVIGFGLGRLFFRLETGAFADEPEMDQALRRLWGGVYTGFGGAKAAGLVEYAEVSLRNGLMRLRIEHGQEHPEIAATMHELAALLLVRGRVPEAERMCRDALAMRERLLGAGSEQIARSRELLGRILLTQGRDEEAAREADAALRAMQGPPGRETDLLGASLMALKARARFGAGDDGACEPLLREALVRRLRWLTPVAPELLSSISDAADLVERAPTCALAAELGAVWGSEPASAVRGDVRLLGAAERGNFFRAFVNTGETAAIGRLIRLQEAMLGAYDPALVESLMAQMRSAAAERLLDVRSTAALRAADILSRRFGPDDFSVLVCVEEAAMVLAYAGEADRSAELGRRACAIRDATPTGARDELFAGNTRRRLAWFLSLAGRHEEAIPEYERAIAQMKGVVGPDHHVVALGESGLAFCLAESGDLERADELSARAIDFVEGFAATPPDQLAQVRLARGHILVALGRLPEARSVLEPTWDAVFGASGPMFPWRRVLATDMVRACEGTGDREAAALWRTRLDGESLDEAAVVR